MTNPAAPMVRAATTPNTNLNACLAPPACCFIAITVLALPACRSTYSLVPAPILLPPARAEYGGNRDVDLLHTAHPQMPPAICIRASHRVRFLSRTEILVEEGLDGKTGLCLPKCMRVSNNLDALHHPVGRFAAGRSKQKG